MISARRTSLWIFRLGGLLITLVVAIVSYFVLNREAEPLISQQWLIRQQTIARAETSNILLYLQSFGNSVAILAQLSSTARQDATNAHDIDLFVEQRRSGGLIGGVILTDDQGIVRYNHNISGTNDAGMFLGDRDYFVWAQSQGEKGKYFVSKPVISRLGATKGETIIVVASPVYQKGVFTGVIGSSLKLEALAERFFGLMKVTDVTEVYLVDGSGDLLYSNATANKTGTNISELFLGEEYAINTFQNALATASECQFQTDKHVIACSPIVLGSQSWLMIISSPAQEIIHATRPFYVRQTAILLLTAFTMLLLGAVFAKRNQA